MTQLNPSRKVMNKHNDNPWATVTWSNVENISMGDNMMKLFLKGVD